MLQTRNHALPCQTFREIISIKEFLGESEIILNVFDCEQVGRGVVVARGKLHGYNMGTGVLHIISYGKILGSPYQKSECIINTK